MSSSATSQHIRTITDIVRQVSKVKGSDKQSEKASFRVTSLSTFVILVWRCISHLPWIDFVHINYFDEIYLQCLSTVLTAVKPDSLSNHAPIKVGSFATWDRSLWVSSACRLPGLVCLHRRQW